MAGIVSKAKELLPGFGKTAAKVADDVLESVAGITGKVSDELSALRKANVSINETSALKILKESPALSDNLARGYIKAVQKGATEGMDRSEAAARYVNDFLSKLPEDARPADKLGGMKAALVKELDESLTAFNKKNASILAVTEKISDLKPGTFTRDQLDSRLKSLTDTAKDNNLIVASADRKPFNVKQTEEALLRGDTVTASEMKALKEQKLSDFDKWEAKAADDAIKNKLRADGKENGWASAARDIIKWPVRIVVSAATVVGLGLGLNKYFDGAPAEASHNAVQAIKTNTQVSVDKAKQESFAQLQRECLQKGGLAGEVTQQCIIPRFDEKFSSLRQVFGEAGASEAERVFVNRVGQKLALALERSQGNSETFNKLAKGYVAEVVKGMENDPAYKDKLPDFEVVDASIQRALQNDPKFLQNFTR